MRPGGQVQYGNNRVQEIVSGTKIIEIHHQRGPASTKWVADNLPPILNDPGDQAGMATLS